MAHSRSPPGFWENKTASNSKILGGWEIWTDVFYSAAFLGLGPEVIQILSLSIKSQCLQLNPKTDMVRKPILQSVIRKKLSCVMSSQWWLSGERSSSCSGQKSICKYIQSWSCNAVTHLFNKSLRTSSPCQALLEALRHSSKQTRSSLSWSGAYILVRETDSKQTKTLLYAQ